MKMDDEIPVGRHRQVHEPRRSLQVIEADLWILGTEYGHPFAKVMA